MRCVSRGALPRICLIIYKMEWHAGYTLPQTIYSCLYVHYLADIDPEVFPFQEPLHRESIRPTALVAVVLNAAISALLKCCDLSWRELIRGRLHDVCTTLAFMRPSPLILGRLKTGTQKSLGYPSWNLCPLHLFFPIWTTRKIASGLYSLVRRATFFIVNAPYRF